MKKALAFFTLLFGCVAMFAQSGPTFPYQAVVRNSQNQLIKDSTFAVDVEVYQGSTLKYSEAQSVTTNANGQFTMNIGGGTAGSGAMTDVADWSVAKFKITYHLSEGDIVSEDAVRPVPYALQAANAVEEQVLTLSNDTIYLTGGSYVKLPDYVLTSTMNARLADTLNEYTLTSQLCDVVNNCDLTGNASLMAILNAMDARIDSLGRVVDSLSNLTPGGDTPGGDEPTEPCTPTSSTHDIEISISELPYSFGDTTFLTGTTAGTYTLHRTNAAGCDSTITINLSLNCGTVTDVDNNEYNTVLIGEQCWMKENLRTTKKPNNENITEGMWTPGSNSVETYGRLYDWTTMMNGDSSSVANPSGVQGICPSGWHVPSDAEWKQMEMAVGMSESDANGTLFRGSIAVKLSGNTGWNSSTNDDAPGNTYAPDRNSTGFSALPAGYYRSINGHNFFSQGAYFWSATARGRDNEAYGRSLHFAKAGVSRAGNDYIHGFSVRCVRDAEPVTLTLTTDKSSATVKLCGAASVSVTYTATVENGSATEYTWSTSGGTPTASTTNTYTVNYTTTGTYTVTCTAAGITATKSVEIASGGTAPALGLCEDCNAGSITVKTSTNVASIVWRNQANDSVSNSTTGLTQSATIPAGNYSATAASSDGCTVTRTATLGNATSHPCTVASIRSNESGTGTQLDSVSDHEGNWYRVVEINGQCWLAENMRCTTSPRQGTVNLQSGGTSGTDEDNPKYYDYNSTDQVVTNSRARGLLYNWAGAMDSVFTSQPAAVDFPNRRGICPEGWHLPTDDEWFKLQKNVLTNADWASVTSASGSGTGYRGTGAGKLTGGCVWSSSTNTTAPGSYSYADRNNTGFSALPVGDYYDGDFDYSGNLADFWSATSGSTSGAWARGFSNGKEGVDRYSSNKGNGYSVRCVRD